MTRNPYLEMTDDEDTYGPMRRNAIVDQLTSEPQPRTRTPSRTPEQTREMLSGPGGRTSYMDPREAAEIGRNAYSGPTQTDIADALPERDTSSPSTGGAAPPNHQRGYDLLDEYGRGYERRMEGSPGVGENAARYASLGGSIYPGVGHVVGALGGAIGAAFAKNAKSAMTDFSAENARKIIAQAHRDALGREASPEYIDQIMRGQGWQPGHEWFGEQPLAYVLDQFAQHGAAERAQRGPETAAAPVAAAAPAGASGPGRYAMEGFDLQRAQDPSFSVKDAFAAAAQNAPEAPPGEDKGALGEWFKKHMQPSIEAQGHKVNWVEGDKVNITGPQGTGTIDWYRGAGAPGGALAWQPEDVGGTAGSGAISGTSGATSIQDAYAWLKQNADPSWTREQMQAAINAAFADVPGFVEGYAGDAVFNNGKLDLITNFEGPGATWSDNLSFVPLHGGGGATAGGTSTSGVNLAPGVSLAQPLGNSNVLQEILAEIQRLQRGEAPRAAILDQLGAGA